ncbi:MAG: sugar ABC transporter ATP-binding protein [Roseiarcus sp.]
MNGVAPILELSGISKSFGGVAALKDVDFALRSHEIHGLVGQNGAGKSTLMKIIAGVHASYEGTTRLDGAVTRFASARDARAAGVGMVYQELSIVPDLTVAENVLLGQQPTGRLGAVDWRRMFREADEHLRGLGIHINPRARMGSLPIGLQQLVEISRILFSGARIIILDEPTSALSPPEVEHLFEVLRRLRDSGRSIVFISHFIDDVLKVSDVVTVFRNGRNVFSQATAGLDKQKVIEQMIGTGHGELAESYTGDIELKHRPNLPVVLETERLSLGRAYRDISLTARAGEVLGLYGFMGCGQIELVRTLFGKLRPESGVVRLEGRPVTLRSTSMAGRAGVAFVSESRRSMLFYHEPVFKNVTISALERISRFLLKPTKERAIADNLVRRLHVEPPSVDRLLSTLSGGNQQKVALAKWLTYQPKLLVLSEPTRGMDVAAKSDVVKIVRALRDQGMAIIVASTEPETILALADRILVIKKGEISREFAAETVSKERLLGAA